MNRPSQITDEQWLTMIRTCPPDAEIVAMIGTAVTVRRKDGTGVIVHADGSHVEVDAEGRVSRCTE